MKEMSKNKFFGTIRRFHLVPKLLCILFAFIFWVYVMEVDSPDHEEVFENVAVTVEGATVLDNERNLSVFSGYETLVDVTVKGQKSVISRYTSEDIKVYVDVSDVKNSGRTTIDLHFDLPSGMTFVKSSVSEIDIFIDKRTTKNFPVTVDVLHYKLPSDKYARGKAYCDVKNITVTGPESTINEIDKAVVEMDLAGMELTETYQMGGTIVLMDQYGQSIETRYVRYAEDVNVIIPIEVKEYKKIHYNMEHGFFSNSDLTVDIQPKEIMIQGDPSIVSRIEYISISDINEKDINGDYTYTEYIDIPDNVSLVPGQPTFVTVDVDLASNFTTKEIHVDEFEIITNEGESFEVLDKSVTVTVVGTRGAVNRATSENVKVTVDCRNYSGISGTLKVPCSISFDLDEESGIIYEYGSYEVRVQSK